MRSPVALFAPVILLAACQGKPTGEAPAGDAAQAPPSIHQVMTSRIIPGSEALWNAVGETYEGDKAVKLAPSTDAEWNALSNQVASMQEGIAQLRDAEPVVASAGEKIQGDGQADAPQVAQIQQLINNDRAAFKSDLQAMDAVLTGFKEAIKARDVDRFTDLGGKLDETCEACHRKFWYPDQKTIP